VNVSCFLLPERSCEAAGWNPALGPLWGDGDGLVRDDHAGAADQFAGQWVD